VLPAPGPEPVAEAQEFHLVDRCQNRHHCCLDDAAAAKRSQQVQNRADRQRHNGQKRIDARRDHDHREEGDAVRAKRNDAAYRQVSQRAGIVLNAIERVDRALAVVIVEGQPLRPLNSFARNPKVNRSPV